MLRGQAFSAIEDGDSIKPSLSGLGGETLKRSSKLLEIATDAYQATSVARSRGLGNLHGYLFPALTHGALCCRPLAWAAI